MTEDRSEDAPALTSTEAMLLALLRLYFLTIADPGSHAWMRAGERAGAEFGSRGPQIAAAMLTAVNEVRLVRMEPFAFSAPGARGMTNTERQFMGAVTATLAGKVSTAHAHAMVLCEGDPVRFIEALTALAGHVSGPRREARTQPAGY